MPQISPQLICFSYHKSGTSLLWHVMTKVCERLGLRLVNYYGLVEQLDDGADVVLLPHSLLRAPLRRPYRAIRLIRDPRDIWVSGYLYHLRCDEGWCRNSDMDTSPPIKWPQVDYSVAHRPEDWKRQYLERLNGQSYQQNLLERSLTEGLDFELEGYTDWTLSTMREWTLNRAYALDVRLEDLMADFDGGMLRIFGHFGFTAEQSQAALEVAGSEDVRRMSDTAMADRPQVFSRAISKWRDVLSAAQIARFEERHGGLLRQLGYEAASTAGHRLGPDIPLIDAAQAPTRGGDEVEFIWLRLAHQLEGRSYTTTGTKTTLDPGLRLSADGATIPPIATERGTYSFVVPSGTEQLRLESRFDIAVDPKGSRLGETRRLGVRVREIAVRSDADEVVIVADDPRLTSGWHAAEREGLALWRWTDGSAKVPWINPSRPTIVVIRCLPLREYPLRDSEFRN